MPELATAPAFDAMAPVGSGNGVTVRLIAPAVVSVLARAGKTEALIDKAQSAFGLALADAPRRAVAGALSALGVGPGRWLFLGVAAKDLETDLGGLASLSDHSDGYALFQLSGPAVRDALAKGVALDLHPDVFTPGTVAVTVIGHIGAIVWRDGDSFVIAVFRSYAASFWHLLSASAAEFGLAVEKT